MIEKIVPKRTFIASALIFSLCMGASLAADEGPDSQASSALVIQSVVVQGQTLPSNSRKELNLGESPENVSFNFCALPAGRLPMRLRYKLEGYDTAWHEGAAEMYLGVRFSDEAGDQVAFKEFKVEGDSTGWTGTLEGSTLTHRREVMVVPPRATQWQVIISSAGPPSTVGIYVVADLVVSKLGANGQGAEVLMRDPINGAWDDNHEPRGWIRDGLRPRMAKIVELGRDPKAKAFAILDDDPLGHAEWRNIKGSVPPVVAGESLLLEWNEVFSMGLGDMQSATYDKLPPGKYRFIVEESGPLGGPARAEVSLAVVVPVPFWQMPWFWATMGAAIVAAITMGVRYLAWRKMQRTMLRLRQQGALERERLRIAQDIHDDLGARVTQISLVSAMAQGDLAFPEKARAEFDRISRMSRELVSALYETVWAVNPENDNLDSMGTYLCQKINELCTQAQLRCRLHIGDLPQNIQISSQTRHNISMAVKEAVHNVIKHACASLVTVNVTFSDMLLTVSIQDDGCGFDAGTPPGNGLVNMKRRLESIGGMCVIESSLGRGANVRMRLVVKSLEENARTEPNSQTPGAPPEPPPGEPLSNYEKISSRG
ncbi:MAG TPA: sensor histidine kinase [Verrucomicrobiae bacterium]|jgi:signal transduction histidine kinase|nr:sensor histidine kinase [Verrucomicrobiae bacterium]